MSGHDIIVVGASAGGVEALRALVHSLPGNLPASIFVTLHVSPHFPSFLPDILNRSGVLPALHPSDGAKIQTGHIYVAPPDYHMMLEEGHISLVHGPKENRHRPAIDPLFRSAAQFYGPRVIGVILTGALDDGTAGLLAIKRHNGITGVQDPNDALYPNMPENALANIQVDFCLPITRIGPHLVHLIHQPAANEDITPVPQGMVQEVRTTKMETNIQDDNHLVGQPSVFSCPECGGVLWEIQDGPLLRFRCRTGHAFSAESVLAEQNEVFEGALWTALKTLEEKASLSRRLAQQARERSQTWLIGNLEEKLHDVEQSADILRQLLAKNVGNNPSPANLDPGTKPDPGEKGVS